MRRVHNRSETARAVTLQHSSRDLDWQIGGKAGVTRYAARIFTALIRAADHDVFNLLRLELAVRHNRLDSAREQIIRTHFGERSRITAKWSALSFIDISIQHVEVLFKLQATMRAREKSIAHTYDRRSPYAL